MRLQLISPRPLTPAGEPWNICENPYISLKLKFATMTPTPQPSFTPEHLGKCLSDATRARLALLLMREGELCVCELTSALDASQPKVSRHLALLRATNLLQDRRQGQWIYYRLHPALPSWVQECLSTMLAANELWLRESLERLNKMPDRPQRCC